MEPKGITMEKKILLVVFTFLFAAVLNVVNGAAIIFSGDGVEILKPKIKFKKTGGQIRFEGGSFQSSTDSGANWTTFGGDGVQSLIRDPDGTTQIQTARSFHEGEIVFSTEGKQVLELSRAGANFTAESFNAHSPLIQSQTVKLRTGTAGPTVAGFGVQNSISLENSNGAPALAMFVETVWLDPTSGSEDAKRTWAMVVNNSITRSMELINGRLSILQPIVGGAEIVLAEQLSEGANIVGFKAPTALAADTIWTLPSADGTSGQVLSTSGAGVLSWATGGAGGIQSLIRDADGDTQVRTEKIADEDTIRFDVSGNEVFSLSGAYMSVKLESPYEYLPWGQSKTVTAANPVVAGFGWSEGINLQNSTGGEAIGSWQNTTWVDATTGTEDSKIEWGLRSDGAALKSMELINGKLAITHPFVGGAELVLAEQASSGNNVVGFKAPTAITADTVWTLPSADGSAGQVLTTSGIGVLSWANTVAGATTVLQDTDGDTKVQVEEGASDEDVIRFDVGSNTGGLEVLTLARFGSVNTYEVPWSNFPAGHTVHMRSSLTPAVGFGFSDEVRIEASGESLVSASRVDTIWTDVTAGAEKAMIRTAIQDTGGGLTTATELELGSLKLTGNSGVGAELRLGEEIGSGSSYVGFKAPDTDVPANTVWALPAADGTDGQVLATDGSKELFWKDEKFVPETCTIHQDMATGFGGGTMADQAWTVRPFGITEGSCSSISRVDYVADTSFSEGGYTRQIVLLSGGDYDFDCSFSVYFPENTTGEVYHALVDGSSAKRIVSLGLKRRTGSTDGHQMIDSMKGRVSVPSGPAAAWTIEYYSYTSAPMISGMGFPSTFGLGSPQLPHERFASCQITRVL